MKPIAIFVILSFVLGGCSLFGSDEKAQVIFRMDQSEFFTQNHYTIKASDGKNVIRINEIIDFESETYSTRTNGTLQIAFEVLNTQEKILSSGEFELDLKKDWRWGVSLQAGDKDYDPLFGCFGCHAYYTFEIHKGAIKDSDQIPDSLYVVVGGNYISDPVVY